jgi:hypothetical protein
MLRGHKTPGAEIEIVKRDIEQSLIQGNMLKFSDQQRAAYLARTPQFQAWLRSTVSDCLIVDGMGEVAIVSAMSYFAATFSRELRKIPNVVSAVFFCGSSSNRDRNSSATSLLMRSLNSQLLSNSLMWPPLDLDSLSKNISNFNGSSLEESWELFSHLVSRTDSSTAIYIIIDGICWIEKSQEIQWVIQQLRNLIESYSHDTVGPGSRLKLLVTSPSTSRHVKHLFEKKQHLILPTDMCENEQSLTQMKMPQHKPLEVQQ